MFDNKQVQITKFLFLRLNDSPAGDLPHTALVVKRLSKRKKVETLPKLDGSVEKFESCIGLHKQNKK